MSMGLLFLRNITVFLSRTLNFIEVKRAYQKTFINKGKKNEVTSFIKSTFDTIKVLGGGENGKHVEN